MSLENPVTKHIKTHKPLFLYLNCKAFFLTWTMLVKITAFVSGILGRTVFLLSDEMTVLVVSYLIQKPEFLHLDFLFLQN